jgi:glycosyltransferase involved in cell wall biosynthesis
VKAIQLSICIATFNRAGFILETLDGIAAQVTDEVEIVIVDGASTDNTEEVVRKVAARCLQLRYIRLDKKGGVDQDYCRAVQEARGEYVWLFTDDDILKPGAVAAVVEATRKRYSLILVNAEVRNADLSVCLQPNRLGFDRDRTYSTSVADRDSLFADTGSYLSFIGGVVMRRELWNQRDSAKYFGTLFVHVGVIFQQFLPGEALAMGNPWIIIRYGNAQWTARSFEIWMFKWPELIWSFPHYSDAAKQRVEFREPWRRWSRLLLMRATGHYTFKDYETWLKPRHASIAARFIAALPIRPLNALGRVVARYIVRKNPSMGLFELESWKG